MARSKSYKKGPLLTPKQLRVLTFIRDFTNAHGYAPTMQELADEFDVSKVTVFEHISALQRKGCLKRARHKARSLRLSENIEFPDEGPAKLPLLGTIAAGRPIEAVEDRENLELDSMFVSPRETFVLRVRGNSMIDDSICDGDFVVCEKRETAQNGETVVALIDGEEATLKRFYKTPTGVRLEARNPAFEPIFAKKIEIQGVVIGVIRRY